MLIAASTELQRRWAVANIGHNHPLIQQAIRDQLEKTSFVSTTTFLNETVVKVGESLVSITPGDFEKNVWFSLSCSDANDLLFKILPKASGRPKILSFLGGYDGETMGAVSLSGHKAHARFPHLLNILKIRMHSVIGALSR